MNSKNKSIAQKILELLEIDSLTYKELAKKIYNSESEGHMSEGKLHIIKQVCYRLKKRKLILPTGRFRERGAEYKLAEHLNKGGTVFVKKEEIDQLNKDKNIMLKALNALGFLNKMFKNNAKYLWENEELRGFIKDNKDKFNEIEEVIKERELDKKNG